jgi:hypothetical protein
MWTLPSPSTDEGSAGRLDRDRRFAWGYTYSMACDQVAPLLVVEDMVVGVHGLVLLPAIPREGLYLGAGDVVDLLHDDERDEVEVLGVEPDRDPAFVRLRVSSAVPIGRGCEVWRSQTQSHVTLKRPARPLEGAVVSVSGAVSRRR